MKDQIQSEIEAAMRNAKLFLTLFPGKRLTLPPEIGRLTQLKGLVIRNDIRLEFEKCELAALPPEIGKLTNLEHLFVYFTQMTTVPPEMGKLTNLEKLYLFQNNLTRLPPELGLLAELKELKLAGNQLRTLPSELGNLTKLELLDVGGNPLESPPPEVVNQGTRAILNFLRNLRAAATERYEAKLLLLGQGGVGKSSILRRLLHQGFQPALQTTFGVDIARVEIAHPIRADVKLQMNAWDFAGQEIEHATHQFFMSAKAVYLLVWNARHGHVQGRLGYWLDMIKSRAPDAPVLLVATHTDQRAPDINFSSLQAAYPQLVGEYPVDNESGNGMDRLREAIGRYAAQLPLMGQPWPVSWQAVEQELKVAVAHHISYRDFLTLCARQGLADQADIEVLDDTMHHLGAILHFGDDPMLRDLVILKPNWITKAISYALTDDATRQALGVLRHGDLPRIWADYDPSLYAKFFSLMNKFELCYGIENSPNHSLIPALLPFKPPVPPPVPPQLQMLYRLSSVPAGLMSRFIVRTHRFTTHTHWREGVILAYDGQLARAEVFEHQREFRLTVGGSSPTNFFALLTDTINQILNSYPGLDVKRLIPCICQGDGPSDPRCGHLFAYEELVHRSRKERRAVECGVTFQDVSINRLLFGIHESARSQVIQEVGRARPDATDRYRQLVLLGQRSVIQEYNRLESIDSRCPAVFIVSRSEDNRNPGPLQLVCQSADGWHLASKAARYTLGFAGDVLDTLLDATLLPLLEETLPLLEHLIPLSGMGINLRSVQPGAPKQAGLWERLTATLGVGFSAFSAEDSHKALGEDLEYMRDLVSAAVAKRFSVPDPAAREQARLLRIQESLRQFDKVLRDLDPQRVYGGLRMMTTPAGHRLWLCPYHYAELQAPSLQLGGFAFEVFLCHNTKDKEPVREVAAVLSRRRIRYWLDEERILPGERWQDAMARGLYECAATIVCVGEHGWGDWQLEELQVSLEQSAGPRKRRVIPVLLPPLTRAPADLPAFLKTRHHVTAAYLDTDAGIEALRQAIRGEPA